MQEAAGYLTRLCETRPHIFIDNPYIPRTTVDPNTGDSSVTIHPVVAKVRLIEADLNGYLIGRRAEIRGAFLALASRQHAFYLGPPGSAKSYLASEVCRRIRGDQGSFFMIELNPFILREEIFGPISLREMRERDSLARKYKGFLPSASVAQLDELWKAPPALLNTLLRILNEREFRNDTEVIRSPLITAFATSNELPPTDRSLDALYDRILLRYEVDPLQRIEDRLQASLLRLSKRAFEAECISIAADLRNVRERKLAEAEIDLAARSGVRLVAAKDKLRASYGDKLRVEVDRISALPAEDQEFANRKMRDEVRRDLLGEVGAITDDESARLESERKSLFAHSRADGLPDSIHHADSWIIDTHGEYFSDEASIRGIADESGMPALDECDTPDVRELLKRVAKWAVKHNYVANYRGFIDQRDLDTLYGLVLSVTFPDEVTAAFYRILDHLKGLRSVRRETDLRLVIAAHAVLENRRVASIEDLAVMKHVLWDRREDRPDVNEAVNKETVELERELEALKLTVAAWEHESDQLDIDYATLSDKQSQREHEISRYKMVLDAHPENADLKALLAKAEQLWHDYKTSILGKNMGADNDPFV